MITAMISGRNVGSQKTGLVYDQEWPWGEENPDYKSDLSDSAVLSGEFVR